MEDLNKVICDDCIEAMKNIADDSIDSCVSDPPYGLSKEPNIREVLDHWLNGDDYEHGSAGFMGRSWDSFVPGPKYWEELYRILKPGAHALIFSGTRTYDLLVIALRMAGFEIRDQIQWIYGSGFPKSMNVGKAIDKKLGKEREVISETVTKSGGMANVNKVNKEQGFRPNNYNEHGNIFVETKPSSEDAKYWEGWGTQLKPANEPICLVRKPLKFKSIVENVLVLGTGAINIDECRIPSNPNVDDMLRKTDRVKRETATWDEGSGFKNENNDFTGVRPDGRWPANILLQHHQDCKHIGFKDVKGHRGYPNGSGGIWKNDYQKDNPDAVSMTKTSTTKDNEAWKGHANADGNETIEDWSCHSDCPIKILNEQSGFLKSGVNCTRTKEGMFLEHGGLGGAGDIQITHGDAGGAARFFYCAKASKSEKNKGCDNLPDTINGNIHLTVKPLKLCRYLVSLITPKGGTVIDPFAGSGSILIAAKQKGFNFIGIDKDEEYCEIARCRLDVEFNEDVDDSYNVVVRSKDNNKSMKQKTFFDLE